MNYLTNYYKNLSEQLQERVNHLQKQLNESRGGGYGRMPHDDASREYAADIAREESDIARGEEQLDRHRQIAMDIAHVHSEVAPHVSRNLGSHNYSVELSKKDLEKTLMSKSWTKDPFTSHRDALTKMGSQFFPPVIYPEDTKNPHWGKEIAVELESQSGEIHPHREELVHDVIMGALEKKLNRRLEP